MDLFRHVGSVCQWQLAQINTSEPEELQSAPPDSFPSSPEEQVEWWLEIVDRLTDRLIEVGPDHPTSSWFGPRPARFWARRAAHEIAVHRWDAEATVTSPAPVAAPQAVDAIDELLEVIVPARLRRHPWPNEDATLHLHATDLAGEWMLHLSHSGLRVERIHAKGDVAARGPASDLLLLLLGRVPPARLEIFGTGAVLETWQQTVRV